jgi:hypothetical protein
MSRRQSDVFEVPDEPDDQPVKRRKQSGDTQVLREIYYTQMKGMGKFDKLWRRLQKTHPKEFKQKEVKAWLAKQRNVQETKQFKKRPALFTSIRGKRPGNIFQIDLMFFKHPLGPQKWAGTLNAVDVFSRRAWSEFIKADPKPANHKKGTPWRMKTKGGKGQKSVLDAFKRILEQSTRKGKPLVPKHVNMDQGNEFTNKLFRDFLDSHQITAHYSRKETFAHNPIVERFNRTLREKMREFTGTLNAETWPELIESYNTDFHSTIKAEPMEVWNGTAKNQQTLKNPTFDFKEGDDVRLLIRKGAFEKGTYEYSKEVYRIYDVQRPDDKSTSKVVRYFVMDSDGEPLSSVNSETRKEEPSFYMGYQILMANDIEESPEYSEKKVKRAATQLAKKDKAAQVKRRLAKEGLDDAEPVKKRRAKRSVRADPLKLVGKQIRVKWFDDGPLTTEAVRRRGKQGKFYTGKVMSFVGKRKSYKIRYEDDLDGDYLTNLTESNRGDFIPATHWKVA